jgi:O-antigen/teichoic acid export membrane protein
VLTLAVVLGQAIFIGNLLLSFILVYPQVAFSLTLSEFLAKRDYTSHAIYNTSCRTIQLLAGIGALAASFDLEVVITLYSLPMLIFSPNFFRNLIQGVKSVDLSLIRAHKSTYLHLGTYIALSTISGYLDKVVIGVAFGFAALGEYQFVMQIFRLAQFLPSVIWNYSVPERASGASDSSIIRIPLLASILLAIAAFFASGPFIGLVYPNYISTVPTVWVFCFAIMPATLASLYCSALVEIGATKELVAVYSLGSLVQFAAIISLMPFMGFIGLGFSFLVGQVLLSASAFYGYKTRNLD